MYLHFYAASALETQARSLHRGSPHRIGLVDRARDHYRRASVLAEAEAEATIRLMSSRSDSSASSYSPAPSVSSSGSVSTGMSSPAPDSADENEPAQPELRGKHLAFHYASVAADQQQRPDSPTRGPNECREAPTSDDGDDALAALKLSPQDGHDDHVEESQRDDDPLERTRCVHRYASALAALHRQITTVHLPASQDVGPVRPPPSNDDMRAIELRTRIARLKAEGWRRRRFDAARYEALREAALADLVD